MADYEWKSDEEKFEAIGFLAMPNVIKAISAQVPENLKSKFEREFAGKYSDEFPYVIKAGSKYSYQLRIQLNDTDGCPDAIENLLDARYGNRINNSAFIKELVNEYGFRFTNEPQDTDGIRTLVERKVDKNLYIAFIKGLHTHRDFLDDMDKFFDENDTVSEPNILEYVEKKIGKRKPAKLSNENDSAGALTPNQMLRLGWDGEQYIAQLLERHDKKFLNAIGISSDTDYEFEWFNDGVQDAEDEPVSNIPICVGRYFIFEFKKKWEDKSVGKGYDIRLVLDSGDEIAIEVKTSRGKFPYFKMTSTEMQEMERMGDNYIIIKVNNFDRLLTGKSPDIITIKNPYEKLFHPKQMKEATFLIGGE